MTLPWPPFGVAVRTPRLELLAATDERLEELVPLVRQGVFDPSGPLPFDDPMSLYEESPVREQKWLSRIWGGRFQAEPDSWRLYFVVVADGRAVGVQDLTGVDFRGTGTVTTFSWLGLPYQSRGLGKEARSAVLHLAFAGLGAARAESDAFTDNEGSNGVSRSLGYEPNGRTWSTRRGESAELHRWLLTRERWEATRRTDIALEGVDGLRGFLGLPPGPEG